MFPAQAGVILTENNSMILFSNVPRTGGGDPQMAADLAVRDQCSPHRRG